MAGAGSGDVGRDDDIPSSEALLLRDGKGEVEYFMVSSLRVQIQMHFNCRVVDGVKLNNVRHINNYYIMKLFHNFRTVVKKKIKELCVHNNNYS